MPEPARPPSHEDFAAAIDWWREAGLDHDYADQATRWLADSPPAAQQQPPLDASPRAAPRSAKAAVAPAKGASPVRFGGDEGAWPEDLAGFARWWLQEPSLETGGIGPRVAPRGAARAELMIIVAHPELQDESRLLSGAEGRLLLGFLRAAGIAEEQAYFASLLPRFSAAPDWPRLAASGCGAVLAHHIHLVQPKRILVLGRNILPLLGHDMAQDGKTLRRFNHKGHSFPYVEGQGPARLLRSAAARRELWLGWLDGTDG